MHCYTLCKRKKKKKSGGRRRSKSLWEDVDLGTEGASHPRLLHVRLYLMSPLSTLLSASYRAALPAAFAKFNFCSLWTSHPKLIYSTPKKAWKVCRKSCYIYIFHYYAFYIESTRGDQIFNKFMKKRNIFFYIKGISVFDSKKIFSGSKKIMK